MLKTTAKSHPKIRDGCQPATEHQLHEQARATCEQTGHKRWFGGSPKIRPTPIKFTWSRAALVG